MVKSNMEIRGVGLVFAIIYITSCSCDPQPEFTNTVEDFIENTSAYYKNEILMIENQMVQLELAFSKELSLVAYNQELAAKTGRQLEARMRSLAALNIKAKLCIQHFIGNVTTENFNLQNKLRACVDTARAAGKPVADNAKNQARNSRTQLHELVNTDLALCRKNNGNSIQKLTDCAREKLKIRETNVRNMIKVSNNEIESSMCRSDIIARTAQECSFVAILDTQSLLSEIVGNINTCIGDRLLEIK